MMMNKKILFLFCSLGFVVLLSAFMPQQQSRRPKNLKVLPKDISGEELHKVMEDFNAALGVKCGFCHASQQDNPKRLDFAKDEKPEKEMARKMIKMTARINKKYFHKEGAMNSISCMTCHNGKEHPKGV